MPSKAPEFFAKKSSYFVLSDEDISIHENAVVTVCSRNMGIHEWHARAFLRIYKWDHKKLLRDWKVNQRKVLILAGVDEDVVLAKSSTIDEAPTDAVDEIVTCLICYDDFPSSTMRGLGCGHQFCPECWTDYLTEKVSPFFFDSAEKFN